MNHGPRFDKKNVDPVGIKQKLVSYANSFLLELWLDSPHKNKILIGSHNLECSGSIQMDRYTDERTGRYDGVHMYGAEGKSAYTESVVNILLSSCQNAAAPTSSYRRKSGEFHTSCPQTKYRQKQKKMYSSAVTGSAPVRTQNRFSPLSENC